MPLKKILNQLMDQVPGAAGAVLADWEGECVEHVARMDSYELRVLGAHHGIIFQSLRRAGQGRDGESVEEVVIVAGRLNTVISQIDTDYFLMLALNKEQLLGPARQQARCCARKLRLEIA